MRSPRGRVARRAAWVLALVALLAPAPAPPAMAAASPFTIVTREYFVSRIGPFRPAQNPRLSAAIRAFGRPSRRRLESSTCLVEWRRWRLRITFANFGGTRRGQTTCTASVGRAQTFVARGSRFRTIRGLRVGEPSSSIRVKHPEARFQRGGFWALVLATFPFGDGSEPAPVLSGLVRGGRVTALTGYIGGAGE